MTPNQNPPVDPAALAAAAETAILPRFPGYREMEVGEEIKDGDMVCPPRETEPSLSACAGMTVWRHERGLYFRPIDPVPHTKGRKVDPETCTHENVDMVCLDCERPPIAPKAPEGSAEAHRPSERCPRWDCYKEAYYLGGRLISCTDSECANYDKDFMLAVEAAKVSK